MTDEGSGKKKGGLLPTLAKDARQGVVGGVAFMMAAAVAVAVAGVLGGSVPAWTLPMLLILAAALTTFLLAAAQRRIDRAEATLSAASARVPLLEAELADLRRRVGEADVELAASARRITEADATADELQQRLAAVSPDSVPLNEEAQSLIRHIRALRGALEAHQGAFIDQVDRQTLIALLEEVNTVAPHTVLQEARDFWRSSQTDMWLRNAALSTIGQLEAAAINYGRQ